MILYKRNNTVIIVPKSWILAYAIYCISGMSLVVLQKCLEEHRIMIIFHQNGVLLIKLSTDLGGAFHGLLGRPL